MISPREPQPYAGRRDRRLVTRRRGGLLDDETHQALTLWAAACAEHVLDLFEQGSADTRPRAAIEAGRRWAHGDITMTSARTAAYAAHAAGHAAATAHMADHELGPAHYALLAVRAAADDPAAVERERGWQVDHLDARIRAMVLGSDRVVQPPQPIGKTSKVAAMGTPNRVPPCRANPSRNSSGSKCSQPRPSM